MLLHALLAKQHVRCYYRIVQLAVCFLSSFKGIENSAILFHRDHLFSTFHWYPDSKYFLVSWLNRISNKCVPQLCQFNTDWTCNVVQVSVK